MLLMLGDRAEPESWMLCIKELAQERLLAFARSDVAIAFTPEMRYVAVRGSARVHA